jgi:phenylalanyl-tRNA synthetase beta chain
MEGACATVSLGGKPIGWLAVASDEAVQRFGLPGPVALAEVRVEPLLRLYPPASRAAALPEFPCIERDLSVVVAESTPWAAIEEQVRRAAPTRLERLNFVGAYRGKQLGAGKKSVTLRLRFRDAQRTLRHDEVDPQVNAVVEALRTALGAELRA